MLKSMTGYGRSHKIINGREILVEIKSVNHRYFEFNARVPRAYGYIEEKLKTLIGSFVSRGKVDVSVSIFTIEGTDAQISVNLELAKNYVDALRSIQEPLNLKDNLSLSTISRFNDIFLITKIEEDQEIIWNDVALVTNEALKSFIKMRENEGKRMGEDIISRQETIEKNIIEIERLSPKTVSDYKEKLYRKIKEVLETKDIDEQRVLTEIALFSEKIAIDEETVRLKSHLKQLDKLIRSDDAIGRKLDFLVQEINREINTIGSKCQDVEITTIVVELKSELEKIREQIQNIE